MRPKRELCGGADVVVLVLFASALLASTERPGCSSSAGGLSERRSGPPAMAPTSSSSNHRRFPRPDISPRHPRCCHLHGLSSHRRGCLVSGSGLGMVESFETQHWLPLAANVGAGSWRAQTLVQCQLMQSVLLFSIRVKSILLPLIGFRQLAVARRIKVQSYFYQLSLGRPL